MKKTLWGDFHSEKDIYKKIAELERKMKKSARELDFESAADFRDQMIELNQLVLGLKS